MWEKILSIGVYGRLSKDKMDKIANKMSVRPSTAGLVKGGKNEAFYKESKGH
jgi:hypothetical protein